jgi:hypothetical protein
MGAQRTKLEHDGIRTSTKRGTQIDVNEGKAGGEGLWCEGKD